MTARHAASILLIAGSLAPLAHAQPSSFSPCISVDEVPSTGGLPVWGGFAPDSDFFSDFDPVSRVRVYFNSGEYQWFGASDIILADDSTLVICGIEGDPVRFCYPEPAGVSQANRIILGNNSELRISNLVIDSSLAPHAQTFISVGDNSLVTIEDSVFSIRPVDAPAGLNTTLIEIGENSTLIMDNCTIDTATASDSIQVFNPSQFGPGGDLTIVRANNADEVSVTNTLFIRIRGGTGSNGAFGDRGSAGAAVPDATLGNGLPGNNGGTGATGGTGQRGGDAIAFDLNGVRHTTIAQNVFLGMRGGDGGTGGPGGQGGTGSQGGDGAGGLVGGNGGRGGNGGNGGRGGKGGTGGRTIIFDITNPPPAQSEADRIFIANNLALDLRDGDRGRAGSGGAAGVPGNGGNGGDGVFDDGSNGARGSFGSTGPQGSSGDVGNVRFIEATGIPTGSLPRVGVHNNIVTFSDAPAGSTASGPMVGINSQGPGGVDPRNNIMSGANFAAIGTFSTSTASISTAAPAFIDPLSDYRLTPGAIGVDMAVIFPLPASINADFDGNPRYLDEPTTPNGPGSSLYGGMALDYGPFESPGNACTNELTGNGRVNAEDILAAITAVDANTFDINGDLSTDFFDLLEYLRETSAGQCD